ncbi:MAG: CPBP family intramembrane metalloprotease [Bacilli bacterium]|jgi:membrane protease YdiL (CAAX protease family)|nr:CPBP family intramembrane metalloprotease [Bacilli bacterium]
MQVYGDDSYQPEKDKNRAKKMYSLPLWTCIVLFLVGSLGLDIVASLIVSPIVSAIHPITGVKGSEEYTQQTIINSAWINFFAYLVIGGILVAIVLIVDWGGLKKRVHSLGNYRFYLTVFFSFIGLMSLSYLWAIIEQVIITAGHIQQETNSNQAIIIKMFQYAPAPLIIEAVFFAPISEELTYRLGLFEAVRRYSRVWAYVVVCLAFGLIHVFSSLIIDWQKMAALSQQSAEYLALQNDIYNELLAFPTYAIAGGVLAFAYEKEDNIFASLFVHMANNILAMVQISASLAELNSSSSSAAMVSFLSKLLIRS